MWNGSERRIGLFLEGRTRLSMLLVAGFYVIHLLWWRQSNGRVSD